MHFKLKRNLIAVAAVLVSVSSNVGFGQLNPTQKQMAQQLKQQERQYKQFMAITIDNIDRICELTDDQKKKLGIAAKGATERSLGKWKKHCVACHGADINVNNVVFGAIAEAIAGDVQVAADVEIQVEPVAEDLAGDVGVEVPGEAIALDVQIADVAIANNGAQMQMWNGGFGLGGMHPNVSQVSTVARESVWTKTLTKVLTEKQKTSFKAAEDKRRKFRRKTAVDAVLAKIDAELILSDDQRTKIGALLDKAVGHQFSVQQSGFNQDFSQTNGMTAVQRMPKTQIAKLLSKTQMARWNEFRRQYGAAEQVLPNKNLLNWGNIFGGFGLN